jgi:hypothetical protein
MSWDNTDVVLAAGVMPLLGIALSNAWQLVISHKSSVSTMDSDEKGAVRVIPDLPRTQ